MTEQLEYEAPAVTVLGQMAELTLGWHPGNSKEWPCHSDGTGYSS